MDLDGGVSYLRAYKNEYVYIVYIAHYYKYTKIFGKLRLRLKFLRSWILHSLAYFSPHPGFTIKMQRARGVKIGEGCYIGPYVHIDLLYPDLVTMEDNVAIGSN